MIRARFLIAVIAVLLIATGVALAASQYNTGSSVVSSGGGEHASAGYRLTDVVGEAVVGTSQSSNFTLRSGFLPLTTTTAVAPSVAFSSATYSVAENATTKTITVNLSGASAQTITVNYATSNGNATAGSDYTAVSGTLTFNPGNTTKTFNVTILDDAIFEGPETVNLALSSPGNATLGSPNTAVLTITDNEGVPSVTRHLPSAVSPSQTFDVTVTFTAPADSFNAIGLVDDAPAGWAVQGNVAWCTPNANFLNVVGSEVQYTWVGPYSSGQNFTVLYKVTVLGNASLPSYTFSGQLGYKIGGGSTIYESIAGDFAVQLGRTPVTGITREIKGDILPGVSITLDGIGPVVSDQSGQYEIMATETGSHTIAAHKDGFRDRTQTINIAGLGPGYAVTCNFQGQYGLIPKAPDIWYALDCVNLWLYPPNLDIGLDIWTALDVINAWLYPVQ